MFNVRKSGLALATLATLGLAVIHPAAAQTPVFTFSGSNSTAGNGDNSAGYSFTAANAFAVAALGVYTADSPDNANVTIFANNTQQPVLATNVSFTSPLATTADGFTLNPVAPTLLPVGAYTIVFTAPTGVSSSVEYNPTTLNINDPNFTFGQSSYYLVNGQGSGGVPSFPNNPSATIGYFGPTFEVAAAPEPSQTAVLGLGVLSLAWLTLSARRRAARDA